MDQLPTGAHESIEEAKRESRYRDNLRKRWEDRELTEEEYYKAVLEDLERFTGPLYDWQRFFMLAAISGRGVEWASSRRGAHYHIVGLSCSICGRR